MQFNGIYTPVITPYHDDLTIDRDGFVALVDHLVEAGVDGIVVGGSTGEYYVQTADERIEMMRLAKDAIDDRVSLIVGTGATGTEESVSYARAARETGADAILVTTPPYAVPTESENALHALEIDRAADLPIMLYNYPGRMGAPMGETYLDLVAGTPNFRAIKESSGDIGRLHLLTLNYPHIQVSCGMDDQALEYFAWGAQSWVCAGSNFLAAEHIALHKACVVDGNFSKGRRIMAAMMPLMQILEQGGKFVQCVKHGVAMNGLSAGPPRKPLRPLEDEEKYELELVVHTVRTSVSGILTEA